MKYITPPEKVLVLHNGRGVMADVETTIIHPKGTIKVIKPEYVAVELKTRYGSRFYGFDSAYIGSDLKVHCCGYNPNFEELNTWERGSE